MAVRLLKRGFAFFGLLLLAIVLLGAGVLGWVFLEGHQAIRRGAAYVALGSSFAAGPGVGQRDPGSPTLCLRSADNYPHLLARKRHLDLVDMTCSGAVSDNILLGGQFFQGPQIDAVTADTRLVTVTVGGNDVAYLGNLMAWSCQNRPEDVSWFWRATICKSLEQAAVEARLAALPDAFQRIADAVRARAPEARLVFVDYVTVLPEGGDCPPRLPISAEQVQASRVLAGQLRAITEEAAWKAGADLVKASDLTRGHDLCSSEPWVAGWTMPFWPMSYGMIAYHPTEKAVAAVAEALDKRLSTP